MDEWQHQDVAGPSKGDLLYEIGADGSFDFEDEGPIRASRILLAIYSDFFRKEFFGPEPKTRIRIKGFNRESFKTFLDCLFGLKDCTLELALLVFPIAHRYQTKEFLERCTNALKPKVMDKNVPLVLNQSTFYKNGDVTDYVINFIKTKYGIVNLLENEEYTGLLSVPAVCKLIENVELHSVVWTLVYKWGENLLKRNDCIFPSSDVKSFFIQHGIFEKISLSHFESVQALINFHEMSHRQFLCSEEILTLLAESALENEKKLSDRSEWVKVDPEYSFKETIMLRKFSRIYKKFNYDILIRPNMILFDPETSDLTGLKVKARYIFRQIKSLSAKTCRTWRDDLHNHYREVLPEKSPDDFLISALSSSDEFDLNLIEENNRPVYKFSFNSGSISSELYCVEVTYNVTFPCRILKLPLDMNEFSANENDLYFTNCVYVRPKNQ